MSGKHRLPPTGSPGDERAVSPVIGVVLMLAVAMLLVSVLQTTAIPQLNAEQEFRHNQDAQDDVVRLESTVDRVGATGAGETAVVDVGMRYPNRFLFVNPPPVSGTLETTTERTVTVENAAATGETGDFWNGSPRTYTTATVAYRPDYNEYGSAPVTVYEPWAVYNRVDDQTLAVTDTDLVDGRVLSFVALDGTVRESTTRAVGVNVAPNSAPVETVTVGNDTAPVRVTVETGIREDVWERLLADELDPDGSDDDRYVTAIDCAQAPPEPCSELTITLEPGTYDLKLGEVSLGEGSTREPAVYLTDVEGDAAAVTDGGRQRLVVEARDRYDNPVSGVTVTASLDGDAGRLRALSPVTDSDGRATFVYAAPDAVDGTRNVTVTAQFGSGDAQRTVDFDVRVVDAASGGGGGDGGGGETTAAESVETVTGSVASQNIGGSDRGRELTFSIATTETATITGFTVTTRNELAGRPFTDRDTTFGGDTLPVAFTGELEVALRDIDASGNLGLSEFVDPTSDEADVIVVLEFADGSTRAIGIT